jgi:hypothetical protein
MTDQPTPETDDFRPCHLTPSDWPAFARAMEIQRNAARAERDALRAALELIAAPMRPDGWYDRDRTACGSIARAALAALAK